MCFPGGSSGYGPRPLRLPRRSLHRNRLELRRCRRATSNDRTRVRRQCRTAAARRQQQSEWSCLFCAARRVDELPDSAKPTGIHTYKQFDGPLELLSFEVGQIDVVQCEITSGSLRRAVTPEPSRRCDYNEPRGLGLHVLHRKSRCVRPRAGQGLDTAPEN
jgi:hypothetical protein